MVARAVISALWLTVILQPTCGKSVTNPLSKDDVDFLHEVLDTIMRHDIESLSEFMKHNAQRTDTSEDDNLSKLQTELNEIEHRLEEEIAHADVSDPNENALNDPRYMGLPGDKSSNTKDKTNTGNEILPARDKGMEGHGSDAGGKVVPQNGPLTEDDVKFTLYVRYTGVTSYKLRTAVEIGASGFNPESETRILIHGYGANGSDPYLLRMKDALLAHADMNVFLVDWKEGASKEYKISAANTDIVGAAVARFIQTLEDQTLTSRTLFHLIGHSLGGHVSAAAGKRLQSPKLGRISGLDVPDYGFKSNDPDNMLDPTDAEFVDETHTHVSISVKGHVDFYPNGGLKQPYCANGLMQKLSATLAKSLSGQSEAAFNLLACDHVVVIDYYTESINGSSCHFLANVCKDYRYFRVNRCDRSEVNIMGFHALRPPMGRRKYYLKTNSKEPYCLN